MNTKKKKSKVKLGDVILYNMLFLFCKHSNIHKFITLK